MAKNSTKAKANKTGKGGRPGMHAGHPYKDDCKCIVCAGQRKKMERDASLEHLDLDDYFKNFPDKFDEQTEKFALNFDKWGKKNPEKAEKITSRLIEEASEKVIEIASTQREKIIADYLKENPGTTANKDAIIKDFIDNLPKEQVLFTFPDALIELFLKKLPDVKSKFPQTDANSFLQAVVAIATEEYLNKF